ncbi:u-box domain-containing protein 33 [Quercus suber]|uniref:RING-type E3 ubiquitin transferase n=1 Tax=Quercus suber TaxID=58331 RepID=A0AAW0JCB8_QUESU
MDDNILHVALGQNVKEYKSILLWAIQNSGGKTICVIYVHQPANMIPIMGARFPASALTKQEVRAYQEIERQNMQKILDEYLLFCRKIGARAESRHIEMDSIEKGIVNLICQLGMRKLVMGAAADKHYSKKMMDLKSKKAIYVRLHAPDGSIDETLYSKLEKAMAEAENARLEAIQETQRRRKAKKDAIEAMHKAQVSDRLCAEELKQRKEIEEALAKEKEEHEKVKIQLSKAMEDLQFALDQKSSLESKIAESNEMVEGLELRIVSAVELLQTYKKERDDLLVERDNALKETKELRRKQGNLSSTQMPQFSEFSFSEIEKATQNFNPSLKIGEGRHGNMYKGLLHEIQVAIKVLDNHNSQDPFQSEVDKLNKLRHPNLVTLIGYCQEVQALIYEYIPNGSLEDRLNCKDNTPPLSWQIRVSIATELCSALIFLHSCKPFSILHGDLTPAKVLLDANFVSKLCDFGSRRLLSHAQSSNNITLYWKTEPKGTSFAYLDPEFLSTGELTLKSDVYSFGITLLQLLTGRPPRGLTKEVQYALDTGKLQYLLDPLAGDWPFEQAKQLAHLALSCSEMYRENRLDLASDVWPVLEPMREDLCGDSSSLQLSSKEHSEPPSYFFCPISQLLDNN